MEYVNPIIIGVGMAAQLIAVIRASVKHRPEEAIFTTVAVVIVLMIVLACSSAWTGG